jgi:single-stranded DNA-binding protein
MRDVNKVILVGRLGADPIQRTTKSGKNVIAKMPKVTKHRHRPRKPNGIALWFGESQAKPAPSF